MTFPDPFATTPQPVDNAFAVPNHNATLSTVDKPQPTVRERLMGNSGRKRAERLAVTDVKPGKQKKALGPYKEGMYVKPIEEFYVLLGMGAMPFHPPFALTMLSPAEEPTDEQPNPATVAHNCAVAWDNAAGQSETVRRALESFTTVSVLGALLAAHTPLIMALTAGTKLDARAGLERLQERRSEQTSNE